ncbi:unnamed protein product [Paramecium primaurelia]|uniref:C2H2-type domain-containing protein n=2 Tax=Paramecium TaxID=5884 RepID=A0A8S1SVQ6_9CILI|nr:unnamed protein product [Paramecium primaurelia]CAD8143466.1 unnamed protein product [Paramecium pentaurelia]
MGRKNRDLSYLKPFCFYCDKTFKNEVYLHQHQKAKHFTCQRCFKKFSSCDSLKNHVESAHHEVLTKIPNATGDRSDIKNKIFGMQGVPRVEIEKRIRKGAEEYWTKILSAQYQQRRKENKQRMKQNREISKKENQQDVKIDNEKEEIEQHEYNPEAKPISFDLDYELLQKQ